MVKCGEAYMSNFERRMIPLFLMATSLCGTNIIPSIFNGTIRWGIVLIVFMFALWKGRLSVIGNSSFGSLIVLVGFWNFMTFFWSDQPTLTLMKSVSYFLVIMTAFPLGVTWAKNIDQKNQLDCFVWVLVAYLAMLIVYGPTKIASGYGDLAGGIMHPIYLAVTGAILFPFVLTKLDGGRNKWLWRLMLFLLVWGIVITITRSAMLIAIVTMTGWLISKQTRKYWIVMGGILAIIVMIPLSSNVEDSYLYKTYMMKGLDADYGIAYSRESTYEETLEAAKEGALLGLGFGVSYGSVMQDSSLKLTAVGYSREKGSSLFAIIEETGLIGALLYILLIFELFKRLRLGMKYAQSQEEKSLIITIMAFLIGFVLQSQVEAWWVAPGAMEFTYFFFVAGLGYGFYLKYKERAMSENTAAQVST